MMFGQVFWFCFPLVLRKLELDAMCVMKEAVQDGVGVSGVAYDFVPAVHWELRRDDR